MPPKLAGGQPMKFTIGYEHGQMAAVSTKASLLNHFL